MTTSMISIAPIRTATPVSRRPGGSRSDGRRARAGWGFAGRRSVRGRRALVVAAVASLALLGVTVGSLAIRPPASPRCTPDAADEGAIAGDPITSAQALVAQRSACS
jgi:hypothetical protein